MILLSIHSVFLFHSFHPYTLTRGCSQVNWPKLNPRPWAMEGYRETIAKVRKDALLGPLVASHERGLSTSRYLNAEEGKKRIE